MVNMALNKEQSEGLESSIFDAHFAANKFIESGKDIHKKLLEISVNEAIQTLEAVKDEIKDDDMVGNYKIHLLVPLQLYEVIKARKANE